MIGYIKELKEDEILDNKLSELLIDSERFKSTFRVSDRNYNIFKELYDGATLTAVAKKYHLSTASCTAVVSRIVRLASRFLTPKNPDSIDVLNLSVRTYNCLARAGFYTISDITAYIKQGKALEDIRNLGKKSLAELVSALERFGLNFDLDIFDSEPVVTMVVYNKATKQYKGLGNNWGSLNDAFVFRRESTVNSICMSNPNLEGVEVCIVLKK